MIQYPNNLFYLKGAFDGDGHYNKRGNLITINVTDFEFLEEIKQVIKEVFNKDVEIINHIISHDNCKEQKRINFCCGKEIYQVLKNRIPVTLGEKKEYLKGLWDAEGSVGITPKVIRKKDGKVYNGFDKWLTIAQKDTARLNIWQGYMKEFGIKTNKLYRTDARSYLSVRANESIINFSTYINFRITRKKIILDKVLSKMGKSQLSKEEINQLIDIYTNTNFGIEYLGRMFNRAKSTILDTLKRYNVDTKKYRQRKISFNDIQVAEEIMNRTLPFRLYISKIDDKEVRPLVYAQPTSIG